MINAALTVRCPLGRMASAGSDSDRDIFEEGQIVAGGSTTDRNLCSHLPIILLSGSYAYRMGIIAWFRKASPVKIDPRWLDVAELLHADSDAFVNYFLDPHGYVSANPDEFRNCPDEATTLEPMDFLRQWLSNRHGLLVVNHHTEADSFLSCVCRTPLAKAAGLVCPPTPTASPDGLTAFDYARDRLAEAGLSFLGIGPLGSGDYQYAVIKTEDWDTVYILLTELRETPYDFDPDLFAMSWPWMAEAGPHHDA